MWDLTVSSDSLSELQQAVALLQAQKRVRFLKLGRAVGFGGLAATAGAALFGFNDLQLWLMCGCLASGCTAALAKAKRDVVQLEAQLNEK